MTWRTVRRQGLVLATCLGLLLVAALALGWAGWALSGLGGLVKIGAGAAFGYLLARYGVHFDPARFRDPERAYALGLLVNALLMAAGMIAGAIAV